MIAEHPHNYAKKMMGNGRLTSAQASLGKDCQTKKYGLPRMLK